MGFQGFKKKHWRKINGGSLRLSNGKRVFSGEDFMAMEKEIPEAFKSSIVLLDDTPEYYPEDQGSSDTPEEEPSSETPEIKGEESETVDNTTEDNKPEEKPKETAKTTAAPKAKKRIKRVTAKQNGK